MRYLAAPQTHGYIPPERNLAFFHGSSATGWGCGTALPPGLRNGSALHARLPGTAPAPAGAVIAFGVTGGPAPAFCGGPEGTGNPPPPGREGGAPGAGSLPGSGGSAEKKTAPGDAQAPGAWRGWHRILHILQDCRPKNAPRTAPRTPRHPQNRACAGPFHAALNYGSAGAAHPRLRAGCRRMRCRVGGPRTTNSALPRGTLCGARAGARPSNFK